jgi:hypothetical protein
MFHDDDAGGAVDAYNVGAREIGQARTCSPDRNLVTAKVLAITAAFEDLHATFELNGPPDKDKAECVAEHRDVAKSDVATAWFSLNLVHGFREYPPRLAYFERITKMIASRLGVPLPAYSASDAAAQQFLDRFEFSGAGNCFHNPEP